jgi:hypothetical protein
MSKPKGDQSIPKRGEEGMVSRAQFDKLMNWSPEHRRRQPDLPTFYKFGNGLERARAADIYAYIDRVIAAQSTPAAPEPPAAPPPAPVAPPPRRRGRPRKSTGNPPQNEGVVAG